MILIALTLIIGGLFVIGYNVGRLTEHEPPLEGKVTQPADRDDEWYSYVPPDPEA